MRQRGQASFWIVHTVLICVVLLSSNSVLASFQSFQAVLPQTQKPSISAKVSLKGLRSQYHLPCLAARYGDTSSFKQGVSGIRKFGSQPIVELNDQFHLGSLTKAMTATLLAIIIKRSGLTWETTLPDALPTLSSIMHPKHRSTTVRTLTSHRSGISIDWSFNPSDLVFWTSLSRQNAYDGRQAVTLRSLSRPPSTSPGSFVYDNSNFIIAGAIVESVWNSTWEDLISSYLFDPLNMTGCGFGPNPERSSWSIDNPWPHTMVDVPFEGHRPVPLDYLPLAQRDNPPALNSAGRVHCPLESYSRFLQAHADGGNGRYTPLGLEPEDWKVLHAPHPSKIDDVAYSPGAWRVIRDSVEVPPEEKGKGYALTHEGSNTYNYATALVTTGGEKGETFVSATNVGGSLAQEATQRTMAGMREGDLFSEDARKRL